MIFLNNFIVMILKLIFLKLKNIILIYFQIKNIKKKQYLTLSNTPLSREATNHRNQQLVIS
jgi:hypothetical protein